MDRLSLVRANKAGSISSFNLSQKSEGRLFRWDSRDERAIWREKEITIKAFNLLQTRFSPLLLTPSLRLLLATGISHLSDCKQLTEMDIKRLCDKVSLGNGNIWNVESFADFTFSMLSRHGKFSWRSQTFNQSSVP